MKGLINYLNKLIQSQTKESSNRATLLAIASVVCLSVFVITSGMFWAIIKEKTVDWLGAAAYITALTALLGAALAGKVQQKKSENGTNQSA